MGEAKNIYFTCLKGEDESKGLILNRD